MADAPCCLWLQVSAVLQPPPYYAPPPDFQQPQQQPMQHMHMGPPQAPMGPPPPKFNGGFGMGPPPPRQPQNAAGTAQSHATLHMQLMYFLWCCAGLC